MHIVEILFMTPFFGWIAGLLIATWMITPILAVALFVQPQFALPIVIVLMLYLGITNNNNAHH
jgi:hypothetical protein